MAILRSALGFSSNQSSKSFFLCAALEEGGVDDAGLVGFSSNQSSKSSFLFDFVAGGVWELGLLEEDGLSSLNCLP